MIFRKRPDRALLRREVARIIYDLKHLHRRVVTYIARLERIISHYEGILKYESNQSRKNNYLTTINIYKAALKRLKAVDVILEYLTMKIETLSLLELGGREVALIKEVLPDVRKLVEGLPDISLIVEDLLERSSDLISIFPLSQEVLVKASSDAKRILDEARAVAGAKGNS